MPEKYRAPLVLCYLEGRTFEEAARQLGWASGTVCGRIARAKEMMRLRLTRRGLAVPAGVVALFGSELTAAAVPAKLAATTVHIGMLLASDHAAAGVSATVATLTNDAIKSMALGKLKAVAAMLLFACTLVAGAGVFAKAQLGEEVQQQQSAVHPSEHGVVAEFRGDFECSRDFAFGSGVLAEVLHADTLRDVQACDNRLVACI